MKFHIPELEKRIQLKLLSKKRHSVFPYTIYNYTNECAFKSKNWDYYTRHARGLILDVEGNVIAIPFKKFFNINEHEETLFANIPTEIPEISEKLDGSMGIGFLGSDNRYYISTRGSFD